MCTIVFAAFPAYGENVLMCRVFFTREWMIGSFCWCGCLSCATAATFPNRIDFKTACFLAESLSCNVFRRGRPDELKIVCRQVKEEMIGVCVC